jgi:LysR family transcriptional regulator, glycine cleavage system transcriptional activator
MRKAHNVLRRLPPLNALRAFEAAARLGTHTAAARELCVTPGAVSRQVRTLEADLGVLLFGGSRQQPELTATGLRLAGELRLAFAQIERGVRAITADQTVLDIGCYSTLAMRWLIPRLHSFQSAWPDIQVRLLTEDQPAAHAWASCDIAIIAVESAEAVTPSDRVLFHEMLGPVLSASLAANGTDPSRLLQLPRLTTRTRLNAWSQWLTRHHVDQPRRAPRSTLFDHYSLLIEAAVSGLGLGVVPWHLVADDIRQGRLQAPFGFVASGYVYVARSQPEAVDKVTAFTDWIKAEADGCNAIVKDRDR